MEQAEVVALGFRYPFPGAREELDSAVAGLAEGPVRREMERFSKAVGRLELAEWEELHTRTLDLSPLFVPYVGHAMWGESYRRGAFMADLKAEMTRVGVDAGGELPDHLEPVLRYLAVAESLPPDLEAALPAAVAAMGGELEKAEPGNPYRHLLAAVRRLVARQGQSGARA